MVGWVHWHGTQGYGGPAAAEMQRVTCPASHRQEVGTCYLDYLTLKYMCIINYCPRLRESGSYFVTKNKLFPDLKFSWRMLLPFFAF